MNANLLLSGLSAYDRLPLLDTVDGGMRLPVGLHQELKP